MIKDIELHVPQFPFLKIFQFDRQNAEFWFFIIACKIEKILAYKKRKPFCKSVAQQAPKFQSIKAPICW